MSQIIENLVNTTKGSKVVLKEAADRYEQMLEDVAIQLQDGRSISVLDMDTRLRPYVTKVRKTLKRQDRIIWALRYMKKLLLLEALWTVKYDPQHIEDKFKSPPAHEQPLLVKKLNQLAWLNVDQFEEYHPEMEGQRDHSPFLTAASMDDLLLKLEHFLGVSDVYSQREPNNVIESFIFDKQPYGEVMRQLHRAEVRLAKKYEGNLADSGKRILSFPNGWAWFDLQKPYCRDEGQALGHCGNSPRAGKNEFTILSLREPIDIDGSVVWKPHCTFVLDKRNGALDERKGRANTKPKPALHKYIVPLLELPLIKKLISGYYFTTQDFELSDLKPEQYHTLALTKPGLFANEKYDPSFGADEGFDVQAFKAAFQEKQMEERAKMRKEKGLPDDGSMDPVERVQEIDPTSDDDDDNDEPVDTDPDED